MILLLKGECIQNLTSFKQKAKKYELDKTHGIFFRLDKNSDGLHK